MFGAPAEVFTLFRLFGMLEFSTYSTRFVSSISSQAHIIVEVSPCDLIWCMIV